MFGDVVLFVFDLGLPQFDGDVGVSLPVDVCWVEVSGLAKMRRVLHFIHLEDGFSKATQKALIKSTTDNQRSEVHSSKDISGVKSKHTLHCILPGSATITTSQLSGRISQNERWDQLRIPICCVTGSTYPDDIHTDEDVYWVVVRKILEHAHVGVEAHLPGHLI